MSEQSIRLQIDGREISATPGDTILAAALKAGIYIPNLCAKKGLSPWGSCRVCTVMVNGRYQPSCLTPTVDGMVVENDTDTLNGMRRDLIAMLYVEGNHYCSFCERSGSCELQALAYRLKLPSPHFPYLYPVRPVDATHPELFIDHNRCILCARCVRASREVDHKSIYNFAERGRHRHIIVDSAHGLGGTHASKDDAATDACPVASIMRKQDLYSVRYGDRRWDKQPIGADVEAGQEPVREE
jgi:[NiFe] hydrogenase diaphorase moiety small subunit